jgi:hypothetical protein
VNTLSGVPLIDATGARENRSRFHRSTIERIDLANSIHVPTGRWASRGWVLVDRKGYSKLNLYSTSHILDIGDTVVLQNLSIVQAQCVTRGLSSDPNAIYLVELTDDRGILLNDWFQFPLTTAYNIWAPAYPGTYYSWSTNSGSPWTWGTMLQDMWNKMNTLDSGNVLGPWPGLPTVPTSVPEGFWFPGVQGWTAFCDVIEYLGYTVACDLTQTNPFTIVVPGNIDTQFTTLSKANIPTDDLEWIDIGAGRIPSYVVVLFRRRNQVYGTEETVRSDGSQWLANAYYSVTVNAPITFTGAVGAHYMWSDFTVEYDQNSNPLSTDVVTANTIAQERVLQYFNRIYRQTLGYMTRTYAGALPFATGARVDGVKWWMSEIGWRTELVRGAYPPWPDLWDTGVYTG